MLISSKAHTGNNFKRAKAGSLTAHEELLFYIFASPWIIGLIIFFLYPAAMSFYYSLTNYDIISPPTFIGIKNYTNLINDALFIKCIKNTLYMVAFSLPINLVVQLIMALMMNWSVRGIYNLLIKHLPINNITFIVKYCS